jgi:threonine aldolase
VHLDEELVCVETVSGQTVIGVGPMLQRSTSIFANLLRSEPLCSYRSNCISNRAVKTCSSSASFARPRLRVFQAPKHRFLTVSTSNSVPRMTAESNGTVHSSETMTNGRNAWSAPGPAAFDLRSDVVTTPTTAMLNAIANCTLLDDVFLEDPTTRDLEALCASLTSKEAGLLVLSGTMGNQVALRTHLAGPPHMVLCDHRSHIVKYEAGGTASLCGALVNAVVPRNGHHLTLEDIKRGSVLSDDVHACPTRVISLENTLDGTIMPLEDVRSIGAWARENGILVHMDGARLWEAAAAGAGKLEEYAKEVDSISLCFSKGLGAPIGSLLVGTAAFIKRARWIRKSIGGGLRQAGVISAPARVAVEQTYLGGLLAGTHKMAKRVEKMWLELGGKLAYPVETNMVWLDLDALGMSVDDFIEFGKKYDLRLLGGRLVIHYQVSEEAIDRLGTLMRDLLEPRRNLKRKASA